jgi:hypothetical protein
MKKNWIMAAALACASAMGTTLTVQADEAFRAYSISDARTARSVAQAIQDESQSDLLVENGHLGNGAACDVCDPCAAPAADDCPPWRLFPQDTCSGWTVYGWINGGIFGNSHGTNSRYNGPVTFADRSDGQINQLYGVIEKTINNDGCGWGYGGRLDVLYGTDWVYNTQLGWETDPATGGLLDGWNSSPYYGLVTPQAYGEVAYNDLSVKVGRFYTIIGYEVVTAPDNFFATHAYTMQYGEPFSHFGALATYKWNDNWTFLGGLVNGWDRFAGSSAAGNSDRIAGLGGVIYTPDHERYTIALTGISGSEGSENDDALHTTRNLYSLVFDYQISDRWNYVLQHDHGWQKDFTGPDEDIEWYGVNQYLFYTINDCWRAGVRAEWFRDDDGARVAGVRPTKNGDLGNDFYTPGGYAGNFYTVSLGLNWTPHANLIVRPEVRYDWYDGLANDAGQLPFADGNRGSQWMYGLDAIILW